ncbi:hypothetical protein M404DRAFT_141130, partial [Pisolithus tinctorius Marx 270]
GTGSGSFSHSVARTVGPRGRLFSYEFHEARAEKAREEFIRHGMQDIVTLTHRNVCKDGFTIESMADAVFLDLPAPWEAVGHAKNALRKDRPTRICCFSPCMEQVLRAVTALNEAGFTDICMYETLLRPHEVQQFPTPLSLDNVVDKLKRLEKFREEKRLRQVANSKRKREDDSDISEPDKRARTGEPDATRNEGVPSISNLPVLPVADSETNEEVAETTVNWSKVCHEVRGHTSYLTFARLVPYPAETSNGETEDLTATNE